MQLQHNNRFTAPRAQWAYTLIEMLVALIILAIITTATGFALGAMVRTQASVRQVTQDNDEARTLLSIVARDVRSAYANDADPLSRFEAPGENANALLMFTMLRPFTANLGDDGSTDQSTAVDNSSNQAGTQMQQPHAGVTLVEYALDHSTNTLTRSETSLPDPSTLPTTPRPEDVLSHHVRAITVSFSDSTGNGAETWSYLSAAAQNPGSRASAAGGAQPGGTSGAAQQGSVASNGSSSQSTNSSQNSTLPSRMTITLRLVNANGSESSYSTEVSPIAPAPQTTNQKPTPPPAATGSGTGAGAGKPSTGGGSGSAGPGPSGGGKPGGGGNNGGGPRPGGGGLNGGIPRPGGGGGNPGGVPSSGLAPVVRP